MYGGRFARAGTVPPVLLGETSHIFPSTKPIFIREPAILNLVEKLKQVEKPHMPAPKMPGQPQLAPKPNTKTTHAAPFTIISSSPVKLLEQKTTSAENAVESISIPQSQLSTAPAGSRKRKRPNPSALITDLSSFNIRLPPGVSEDTPSITTFRPGQHTQYLISHGEKHTHCSARAQSINFHENGHDSQQPHRLHNDSSFEAPTFSAPQDHIWRTESSKWGNPNKIRLGTKKMVQPATSRKVRGGIPSSNCIKNDPLNLSLPHQPGHMSHVTVACGSISSGMQATPLRQRDCGARSRRSPSITSGPLYATNEEPEDFSDLVTDMGASGAVSSPYMPITPVDSLSRSDSSFSSRSGSLYDPAVGIVYGADTPLSNSTIAAWCPDRLWQGHGRPQRLGSFQNINNGPILPSIEMDNIWEIPDSPRSHTPETFDTTSYASRSASGDLHDDEYDAVRIVGERIGTANHDFIVNWVGCSERTWIPSEDCFCPDMVGEFREIQRLELAEAGQAHHQADIETLQRLADAKLARKVDSIKLPKASGWRYSRRNARNGRFQGSGKGNSYVEFVRLPTVPPARHDRGNTAILPRQCLHRPWNVVPDSNRNEAIRVRTGLVDSQSNYPLTSHVKREDKKEKTTPPVDQRIWTGRSYSSVYSEQERVEMERRQADDAEARKRHLADVQDEETHKLDIDSKRNQARVTCLQKKVKRANATQNISRKQLSLKEPQLHNDVSRDMEDMVRKFAKESKKAKTEVTPKLETPESNRTTATVENKTSKHKKETATPKPISESSTRNKKAGHGHRLVKAARVGKSKAGRSV